MIEGKQIYLRPIESNDTDNMVRWRNQGFVRKYFIYQGVFTKEGHETWLNTKVASGEVVQFIIHEKTSNKPIGSVYLRDINQLHKKAEYGIVIGEIDYQGKGIGTEAAILITDYAFHELHLHKVMLRVFAQNTRAIASYKKAGFFEEGYLKDEVCINGIYKDIIFMAKINRGDNLNNMERPVKS